MKGRKKQCQVKVLCHEGCGGVGERRACEDERRCGCAMWQDRWEGLVVVVVCGSSGANAL